MAALRTTLCAFFMLTAALSQPVCLGEGDDSMSSESSQLNSSEETADHVGPSQETLTDTSNAVEEVDPSADPAALLPSADAGPSAATLDASPPPYLEDPQTSTDAEPLGLAPDDPSQTVLGVEIAQDMPNSDPAHGSINADTGHVLTDTEVSLHPGFIETDTIKGAGGTNHPQVITTTYHGLPQDATPPFPPHITKTAPQPYPTAPPHPVAIDTIQAGVPVCFTFQFATAEPEPPRGDSM